MSSRCTVTVMCYIIGTLFRGVPDFAFSAIVENREIKDPRAKIPEKFNSHIENSIHKKKKNE